MIAEWIVIIAVSSSESISLSVPAMTFAPNLSSIPAIYQAPPPPPPPTITVVKVASREEAEAQARGYYLKGSTMWTDEKLAVPGLWASVSSSRAVVVIAPDGKVYRVDSVEKKRKVVREVEEPDGWETKWTDTETAP